MLARARPGVAAAGAGEAGPCQGPLPAAPLAPAQQSQVSGDAVHSPPHPAPVQAAPRPPARVPALAVPAAAALPRLAISGEAPHLHGAGGEAGHLGPGVLGPPPHRVTQRHSCNQLTQH